jgi:multiple sugar transport system permease protein
LTKKTKKKVNKILFYAGVSLFWFLCFFPFYWVFMNSFKTNQEIFDLRYILWPKSFKLVNYISVFRDQPFLTYLKNSAIVATSTTLISLFIGSFTGYALARLRFKFKNLVLTLILSISMFPGIAIVSPLFITFRNLGLLNSYPGLIIPYISFSLPLTVFILNSYFKQIPFSLEESAMIDGCSRFQAFYRVLLPLSIPGVFTAAILTFIGAWNEYLFALIFNKDVSMRTVPVGITTFQGVHTISYDLISAATVIVTVPLMIVVLVLQKKIISGLTAGAVKG